MPRLLQTLAATALLLGAPARAVDVVLSVDVAGCAEVVSDVIECEAAPRVGTEVVARWALDVPTGLAGYDLEVRWDPSELSFVSAQQILPDSGTPAPFTVAPLDPAESGAAAFLSTPPIPPETAPETQLLFEITYDRVALADDGEADLDWFANGAGLSPAVLDNPAGAGIDLVTEATPECRNGIDDDGDDGIDFDGGLLALGYVAGPADPDCKTPDRNREASSSRSCGVGPELPLLLLPILAAGRRRRAARRA